MFVDLDETMRLLLIREVPLDPAEVDVNFEAPDREWSGRLSRPTINCFLYDVRENHEFRRTDFEARMNNGRTAVRQRPVLRFDATYQVSAWARAPEDEHRLLWRVLAALVHFPTLPEDILQGDLKGQPVPTPARVAQPELTPKNPADLWQAVENRIRPALTYVVTLPLDPAITFTSPLVFTSITRLRRDGDLAGELIQIGGTVRLQGDGARGIPGAIVLMRETGVEVKTDAAGRFVFRHAHRGPITLVVRTQGRPDVERKAEVPSDSYDVEV